MERLEATKGVDKYSTLLYTYEEGEGSLSLTLSDSSDEGNGAFASGYSTAAALNTSHNATNSSFERGLDLCGSDPGRLYHSLNTSLSDSSMSHDGECNVILRHIESLTEEEARKWLMEQPPKELLRKLARGESVAVDIRKSMGDAQPLGSECPWNERFQALLDLEDSPAKFAALSNVGSDFAAAASVFGRIIIEELFVPYERKTIKPLLALGGVHGGLKYVVHGILFKFCLANTSAADLFGGSDANAMKTAGNELKALVSIFNAGVKDLRLPLMSLVDFRGYRVLAMSVLPICASTLRYGSSDGGKQVHDDDQEMGRAIKQLADILGLKRHRVGSQNLYLCGDVEGHRGTDGRLYLIDLSRLFPPEYPLGNSPFSKNDIWFKLLRAECVRSYPTPLSSDALSAWGAAGTARENNAEVKLASQWLRDVLVPQTALEIDAAVRDGTAQNSTFRVRTVVHRHGVNIRHLGLVRKACSESGAKDSVMAEIMARTIKCDLNRKLRDLVAELRLPVDQPYRHLIVTQLNVVLGRESNHAIRKSEKLAHVFWTSELQEKIIAKFGIDAFAKEELEPGTDLRTLISSTGVVVLIRRVLGALGVALTRKSQTELVRNPKTFSFVLPDIMSWQPRVKMASFLENYTGQMLVAHGEQLRGSEEAMRLFDGADQSFQRAVSNSATNVIAYESWGRVSCRLAEMWAERSESASDEAAANARFHFDRMSQAWASAIALSSDRVGEAWDCAKELRANADAAGENEPRRRIYLYGALHLYVSLNRNRSLNESSNFLFELGDTCRAAAVDDTGTKMRTTDLIRLAATCWQDVFAVDLEKRFHLWDVVVHDNPTRSDRIFLASMVMMAEESSDLMDDLLQCFYGRSVCDFSDVAALEESAFIHLASDNRFCLSRLDLSRCVKLTGESVLDLSQSCEFLVDLRLSGIPSIADDVMRLTCKRFRLLEAIDVSHCARVTDASLTYFSTLPHLARLGLAGCDLSDHGLLETMLPNANLHNHEYFPSLRHLDVRLVPRVTYSSVHKLKRGGKPSHELLHTSVPSFMEKEKHSGCELSEEGCCIDWRGEEPSMCRSNAVIPSLFEPVFYFELVVLHQGSDGAVGLGLAPRGHSLMGMPGWNMQSFGYHGDDGAVFSGESRGLGKRFGPSWGTGDTVGLGVKRRDENDARAHDIFATKNGEFLGVMFSNVQLEDYYAVVGSMSVGAKLKVVFDRTKFRFDLATLPPLEDVKEREGSEEDLLEL